MTAAAMDFTEEQLHAIDRRRGELLLDAGAGSGKTSVLVERFARAVLEDGIAIGQILTITFTEKAAAELRERVRARLIRAGQADAAHATEGAWISTIHAFCARLLKTHALEAGIDPDFTVLDEREAAALRSTAFDSALAACARDQVGAELIAAHGTAALRATIVDLHGELRAQGMLEPRLPAITHVPLRLELDARAEAARKLARTLHRRLGRERGPGKRVLDALVTLEQAPEVLEEKQPWPGDVRALRLPAGANALRTELCDEYNSAIDAFAAMLATVIAAEHRKAFDLTLAEFDSSYTALKRERSGLDFADLELLARELLRRHDVASRYQERFLRVMVDEMQDVNHVQLELIDLVAGLDLFMVGDAQQSIYGFRHADVELFEQRGARLEQIGARASLATNFRSRPEILTVLNAAFRDALAASFRPLRAGRESAPAGETAGSAEPAVELIVVDRDAAMAAQRPFEEELEGAPWRVAEARALAARVAELIGAGTVTAGDVVVLARATTGIQIYERALELAGVPTYVVGGRGYWSHPQVIELTAYLRALANPQDTLARSTVLFSRLCGLSLDGLVLEAAGAEPELSAADAECLRRFREWFEAERREAAWVGPERLLDRALKRNGYELALAAMPDGRRRLANIRKLMRLAREWQESHGSDLRGFVDSLSRRAEGVDGARESEAPVESEALGAVRLMTIHRSKGLEFPVVCVADLGRVNVNRVGPLVRVGRDGARLGLRLKLPGFGERFNALDYDALAQEQQRLELAEERRLFYVAMTRAKERLIVSGAARLLDWEASNRSAPIGWVGPALVPDIAKRAVAGGASVTPLGVRVQFVAAAPAAADAAPTAPTAPTAPDASDASDASDAAEFQFQPTPAIRPGPLPEAVPPLPPPRRVPLLATLSYTTLASYERCPYRFYAERILGLPEAPPIPRETTPLAPVVSRQTVTGAARGRLIHELLANIDFQTPSLRVAMPTDIRAQLAGLLGSSTFQRLAALQSVRREQRFAFPLSETLITGVFDLIGRELGAGQLLVVDYKSDTLDGAHPHTIVAERYMSQRATYALAALKLGAVAVEVIHLFLEAPDDPVTAVFTSAEADPLERALAARVAGPLAGNFPVTDAPRRRVCEGCPAQGGLCPHPLELTNRR